MCLGFQTRSLGICLRRVVVPVIVSRRAGGRSLYDIQIHVQRRAEPSVLSSLFPLTRANLLISDNKVRRGLGAGQASVSSSQSIVQMVT